MRQMVTQAELAAELEKTQAREKRLLELLEELDQAVYRMAWPGGHYEYASPGIEHVSGYSAQDFLDDPTRIKRAVHLDSVGYMNGKMDELSVGKVSPTFEYKIIDPAGNERWIVQSNRGVFDKEGNLVAIEGLMRNVTAQKQAQQERERLVQDLERMVAEGTAEIRDSEAKFRSIVESLPMGMVMCSLQDDGRLVFSGANPAASRVLGVDMRQYIGQSIEQAFPSLAETKVAEHYRKAALDGTPWQTERITYEGKKIQGAFEVHAFQTSPGNMVAAFLDITKRLTAEAERERLQQQAIETQRQAIQELSTPIIPIMERIIVMPLVGSIDSQRARHIMRTLLQGIREHRAKLLILDITGVPIVDSGVAGHLDKTIQAARLKGARTIITGMSDAVAEAIVDLGIDWSGVETLGNLQTGLVIALDRLGVKLSKA